MKTTKHFMESRRQFMLKSWHVVSTAISAAALAPFGLVNAHAQTASGYKAMVCIFLFGGNDANNMVVPMGAGYAPTRLFARGSLCRRQACCGLRIPRAELSGSTPACSRFIRCMLRASSPW